MCFQYTIYCCIVLLILYRFHIFEFRVIIDSDKCFRINPISQNFNLTSDLRVTDCQAYSELLTSIRYSVCQISTANQKTFYYIVSLHLGLIKLYIQLQLIKSATQYQVSNQYVPYTTNFILRCTHNIPMGVQYWAYIQVYCQRQGILSRNFIKTTKNIKQKFPKLGVPTFHHHVVPKRQHTWNLTKG